MVLMTRDPRYNRRDPARSGRAWRAQRLRVLRRDQYLCQWCGGFASHADHVIPVVKGGGDEMENLVASCRRCNLSRGSRDAEVFFGGKDTPLVFSSNLSPATTTSHPSGPFSPPIRSKQG